MSERKRDWTVRAAGVLASGYPERAFFDQDFLRNHSCEYHVERGSNYSRDLIQVIDVRLGCVRCCEWLLRVTAEALYRHCLNLLLFCFRHVFSNKKGSTGKPVSFSNFGITRKSYPRTAYFSLCLRHRLIRPITELAVAVTAATSGSLNPAQPPARTMTAFIVAQIETGLQLKQHYENEN